MSTAGSRRLAVSLIAAALVAAACSGAAEVPIAATTLPAPAPSSVTQAIDSSSMPSSAPSFKPSARAEPTPIPIWTGIENEIPGAPGRCAFKPCEFTAGTYRTYGPEAFLPGLTTFIPDGWRSTEQDDGEFNLLHPDFPDSGLLLWLDIIPVMPDGSRVTGVPSTVAGITGWLRANPQLVVTDPVEAIVGTGLQATTFVVDVADGAVNMDPGCDKKPTSPACFPLLTDPAHWGDGAWWVSALHRTRYYLADIGAPTDRHLLVVAVVGSTMDPGPHVAADPAAELLRFEKAVAPIIDSLDVSGVTFN
jgi:hypothetical protein